MSTNSGNARPSLTSSEFHPLAKFPQETREAHDRFVVSGDPGAIGAVVLAVILDHQPSAAKKGGEAPPADTARLIEDLGFDSLALAEVVFFLEDVYKVAITNAELQNLLTVGEIRTFVQTKVTQAYGSSPA